MPRTRIHADAAARSRAWRERKRNVSATEHQPEKAAAPSVVQAPFKIIGRKGQTLAAVIEDEAGSALLMTYDAQGRHTAALGVLAGEIKLCLFVEGTAPVSLQARPDIGGVISLLGPQANTSHVLFSTARGSRLKLLNSDGQTGTVFRSED